MSYANPLVPPAISKLTVVVPFVESTATTFVNRTGPFVTQLLELAIATPPPESSCNDSLSLARRANAAHNACRRASSSSAETGPNAATEAYALQCHPTNPSLNGTENVATSSNSPCAKEPPNTSEPKANPTVPFILDNGPNTTPGPAPANTPSTNSRVSRSEYDNAT
jgi:hypothetical protein